MRNRIIEPFENHFWVFYDAQTKVVQEKIDYVLNLIITLERVPSKFFKHLEEGIYEIRIKVGSDIFRLFSFFDHGKLVILLHGIQKKTDKVARREIDRAKGLRVRYYESKDNK